MSVKGIKVKVATGQVSDEQLEQIYVSLSENFAIKSIDMTLDEDSAIFFLGVEMPNGLDSDELLEGIVDDAFANAFGHDRHSNPELTSKVAAFC